jgi:hypothetical protein
MRLFSKNQLFLFLTIFASSNNVHSETNKNLYSENITKTNVCRRVEEYAVTVEVKETETYQQRTSEWCWNVPPRCSKYKQAIRTVVKPKTLIKNRVIDDCCAGYEENLNKTECIPICSGGCINGVCIEPGTCQCQEDFVGVRCASKINEMNIPLLPSHVVNSTGTITTDSLLIGHNICSEFEEFPVEIKVDEKQSYQERGSQWCMKVPPRCSVMKTKTRTITKTRTVKEIRAVKKCCEGFKENLEQTQCIVNTSDFK